MDTGTNAAISPPPAPLRIRVHAVSACNDLGQLHAYCDNEEHGKINAIVIGDGNAVGQYPLCVPAEDFAAFIAAAKAGAYDRLAENGPGR